MVNNRARGFCWLLRDATAGKETRIKGGGDKTKIHELIVAEHLSKQWGEPQSERLRLSAAAHGHDDS